MDEAVKQAVLERTIERLAGGETEVRLGGVPEWIGTAKRQLWLIEAADSGDLKIFEGPDGAVWARKRRSEDDESDADESADHQVPWDVVEGWIEALSESK